LPTASKAQASGPIFLTCKNSQETLNFQIPKDGAYLLSGTDKFPRKRIVGNSWIYVAYEETMIEGKITFQPLLMTMELSFKPNDHIVRKLVCEKAENPFID